MVIIKTVNIDEVQTKLPKLLSLVTAGIEVIIEVDNKQVVKIIPTLPLLGSRIAGLNKGKIWVTEDFDEPYLNTFGWEQNEPVI